MSEPFDVERIRPHARTGDDANIGIKAHLLRAAAAEIDRLRAWMATEESAVVAEISKACNENAERAEKAETDRLTALDQAWEAVNVLGAPDTAISAGNLWERGYCDAILDALREIEKLGGMQPERRKEVGS